MLAHAWKRSETLGKPMPHWFEELGFVGNPFYTDPVPNDLNAIGKGFVNRGKERRTCEDFMQLRGHSGDALNFREA